MRSSHVRRLVSAIGTTLVLGIVPGNANATAVPPPSPFPPGVHVDPGSPAAKEYAIPLGQARAGGSAGGSSTPFGTGITPAAGSGTTAAPRGGITQTPRPNPGSTVPPPVTSNSPVARTPLGAGPSAAPHAGRTPLITAPAVAPADKVLGRDRGAGGAVAWMAGTAALVVALGGFVGTALARRKPRTSRYTT